MKDVFEYVRGLQSALRELIRTSTDACDNCGGDDCDSCDFAESIKKAKQALEE